MLYNDKYLKYKNKYFKLKYGGSSSTNIEAKIYSIDLLKKKDTDKYNFLKESIDKEKIEFKNQSNLSNLYFKFLNLDLNKVDNNKLKDKLIELIDSKNSIELIEKIFSDISILIDVKKIIYEINFDNKTDLDKIRKFCLENKEKLKKAIKKLHKKYDDTSVLLDEYTKLIEAGPKSQLSRIGCIKFNDNADQFILIYSETNKDTKEEKYIGSVTYYIYDNDLYFISIYKTIINNCQTCDSIRFAYRMISEIEKIGRERHLYSIRTCEENTPMKSVLKDSGFFKREIKNDHSYNIKILNIPENNVDFKKYIKYLSDYDISNNRERINKIILNLTNDIEEIIGISDSILSLGSKDINNILDLINKDTKLFTEFALAAVRQNSLAIEYVPPALINQEIALEAVKQNGLSIEYVPPALINQEIVLAAVSNTAEAILSVKPYLINQEIALTAVSKDSSILQFIPPALINQEIALTAVSKDASVIKFIPTDLSNYQEIALTAVAQNSLAIEYVPPALINQEIALTAVSKDASVIKFIPKDLSNYQEITQAAVNASL